MESYSLISCSILLLPTLCYSVLLKCQYLREDFHDHIIISNSLSNNSIMGLSFIFFITLISGILFKYVNLFWTIFPVSATPQSTFQIYSKYLLNEQMKSVVVSMAWRHLDIQHQRISVILDIFLEWKSHTLDVTVHSVHLLPCLILTSELFRAANEYFISQMKTLC